MKHARKMILVDANTATKSSETDPIVKAINSLTSATEFSRNYYGTNTTAIAYLDQELKQILEHTGLNPTEKLQLYSQILNRYLLLQRQSEKQSSTTPASSPQIVPVVVENKHSIRSSSPTSSSSSSSPQNELLTDDGESSHGTIVQRTPVTPKEVYEASPRGYRSNLPRSTPKSDILRPKKDRAPSRYGDYFTSWTGRKPI